MNEVVVAGGGPAGAATALALARGGLGVTIIERAVFPRRKVCGEYINAGAVRALERLGLLESVSREALALRGIRLISGATKAQIPFSSPALSLERSRLDAVLLDAAVAAGASVIRGRVEGLDDDGERVTGVRWRDEAGELHGQRARFVVGADGAGSLVARKAGLTRVRTAGRFAVGGHYAGFEGLDGWIELFVGDGAYFAINPLDSQRANVMVVVPKRQLAQWSRDVDDGLSGKAAVLGAGHRSFAGTTRVGARVCVGPLVHETRAAGAPGVLLVGDAAGFLNPFTGQGVLLALTTAERAAETLLRACATRTAETSAFETYAGDYAREFAIRRRACSIVDALVNVAPLARRAAAGLRRAPQAGAILLEALSGMRPARDALSISTLGRLLV